MYCTQIHSEVNRSVLNPKIKIALERKEVTCNTICKTVTKLSSKWLAALNHKAKIGTSTGQGQQEVICSTICKMLTQA